VLLSGEAGIGKSRLTAALLEKLTGEPHTRLRYYCSPQHTDSALYPVIGQMERAAGLAHDDRPQAKLDKLDTATDSAVDAVVAVDEAVRSVSYAVKTPVQKLAGLSAGVSHGWASLRTRRNWRDAVDEAKAAAARHQSNEELANPLGGKLDSVAVLREFLSNAPLPGLPPGSNGQCRPPR